MGRSYPLSQLSFDIAIDPVEKFVGWRAGNFVPSVAGVQEQCHKKII